MESYELSVKRMFRTDAKYLGINLNASLTLINFSILTLCFNQPFSQKGHVEETVRNHRHFGGDRRTFRNVDPGSIFLHAGRDTLGLQVRQRPQVQWIFKTGKTNSFKILNILNSRLNVLTVSTAKSWLGQSMTYKLQCQRARVRERGESGRQNFLN